MTATLDRALLLAADRAEGKGDRQAQDVQAARLALMEECRTPADLAARFDPRYVRTPALDLIAERLVQAVREHDGRMVLSIPPQEGKTSLLRWFCAWLLMDDPDRRVVYASYAASLARASGRVARSYIQTYGGPLGLHLARDHADASDWQLGGYMGGVVTTGVGGALTGRPADCVTAETAIITENGKVTAAQLAALPTLPRVLSWNHALGCAEWRQVQAARVIPRREVVELRTAAGRTLRCTADHRVYVDGRGYVPAVELGPGDRLVVGTALPGVRQDVPEVRIADQGAREARLLLEAVPQRRPHPSDRHVRALRQEVHPTGVRGAQGSQERLGEALLLESLQDGARHGTGGGAPTLPHMRRLLAAEAAERREVLLSRVSPASHQADGVDELRSLRLGFRDAAVRARQEAPARLSGVLLEEVRGRGAVGANEGGVQDMRRADDQSGWDEVLLRSLPANGAREESEVHQGRAGANLPPVRARLQAQVGAQSVLRSRMCERSARRPDGRQGELEVPGRHQLRGLVSEDASRDHRSGRRDLHGLQAGAASAAVHARRGSVSAEPARRAPHQPRSTRQSARELDPHLPVVPHGAPQVEHDTVSVVRRVRDERVTVYDFQVEGNRNFFAGEVLVHNCLIVDDPIRNRQDAESPTIRENLHTWWTSVALTRLAPGAPTLVVQTRWHEDDLAGRMEAEGWPAVNVPALSDGKTPDALDRPAGEWLASARGRTVADWEKKRRDVGERDFASLYQGRPAPLEGGVFKKAWFDTWRVDEPPPGCLPPVVVVDPADNEGDGDEAGIIVGTQHPGSKKVYVLDDLSAAMTVARWARLALLTCVRREAPTLVFERSLSQLPARIRDAWAELHRQASALRKTGGDVDAALGRLLRPDDGPEVRAYLEEALAEIAGDVDGILAFGATGPRLKAIVAKGSKQVRMQLVAPMWETGRAVMVGKHAQLEHVASVWQPGQDSPDRVDAMTHLCQYLGGTATVASLGRSQERVPTSSTSLRNRSSSRVTRSTRR